MTNREREFGGKLIMGTAVYFPSLQAPLRMLSKMVLSLR